MTAPNRAVCEQVREWILAEVPAASTWTPYLEEPITPQGTGLLVWWENFGRHAAGDTIATPGGWQDMTHTYGIRFWEPAPEQVRLLVSDDAADRIETAMGEVVAVLFNHATELPAPNGHIVFRGGARFNGQDQNGIQLRGFEISFTVDRGIEYT